MTTDWESGHDRARRRAISLRGPLALQIDEHEDGPPFAEHRRSPAGDGRGIVLWLFAGLVVWSAIAAIVWACMAAWEAAIR